VIEILLVGHCADGSAKFAKSHPEFRLGFEGSLRGGFPILKRSPAKPCTISGYDAGTIERLTALERRATTPREKLSRTIARVSASMMYVLTCPDWLYVTPITVKGFSSPVENRPDAVAADCRIVFNHIEYGINCFRIRLCASRRTMLRRIAIDHSSL
jgi:hypothetical protein